MFSRLVTGTFIGLVLTTSNALAVDGRGLTDGSVYDHKGVSPYEPSRAERAKKRPVVPPEDDYAYVKRCYWTVKTTDGWWPTGATQVCFREKVK